MLMSLKLPDEVREALRDETSRPVAVEDEVTHRVFVLMPWNTYEKVQSVFAEGFSVSDAYAAQSAVAGAAGWDDPEMDIYNSLVDRP